MALQKSYEDNAGVVHGDAYWRLMKWDISPLSTSYLWQVAVYHNQAARDDNKEPVCYMVYGKDREELPDYETVAAALHSGGTGSYIYTQLKNLPELSGATDIIE